MTNKMGLTTKEYCINQYKETLISNILTTINKSMNTHPKEYIRGHSSIVATRLPPTSEVGGSNPRPYVGNLVVAYGWSGVYSTEP